MSESEQEGGKEEGKCVKPAASLTSKSGVEEIKNGGG